MLFLHCPRSLAILRSSRRSLWTQITVNDPVMHRALDQITMHPKPDVCVALVSSGFAARDYRAMLTHMKSFQPTYLLGCVVDRVVGGQGVSLWAGYNVAVKGFCVEDSPSRPKARSISVGRWGRVEGRNMIDEAGWDAFGSVSRPAQTYELPSALTSQGDTPPSFVFLASDHEPDHLLQALDFHYPMAAKVGVVGAATPFVTGQPYTLFYNGEAMGAGIVGFAAYDTPRPNLRVEHNALTPLGKPMLITRCRGNIILDLDERGATGLLLNLIQRGQSASLSKDQEFYLGIYPPSQPNSQEMQGCADSKPQMTVARVVSGDPSRGNMAVDTTMDLQEGQTVQFLQRTASPPDPLMSRQAQDDVTLAAVPLEENAVSSAPGTLHRFFGATSENGVIEGRPGHTSQLLQVPFSKVIFSSA